MRLVSRAIDAVHGFGSLIGIRTGTEEPGYDVEERTHGIEIRRYASRLAAQTAVPGDEENARNTGFRRLAGYIFGANTSRSKIAMTAPVSQARRPDNSWSIRFYMPSRWTRDTLPTPECRDVELVEIPGETMAVLRFTGRRAGLRADASARRHQVGGDRRTRSLVLRSAVDPALSPSQRGSGAGSGPLTRGTPDHAGTLAGERRLSEDSAHSDRPVNARAIRQVRTSWSVTSSVGIAVPSEGCTRWDYSTAHRLRRPGVPPPRSAGRGARPRIARTSQRTGDLPAVLHARPATPRRSRGRAVPPGRRARESRAFDDGTLVGVANYTVLESDHEASTAECAVAVGHPFQHHGIGTALLQRLVGIA